MILGSGARLAHPDRWPPSHGDTKRLGFDARRKAPATRPNAVVHESIRSSHDSCTTRVGRVLGLLRRPTRRTRSASTPRRSRLRPCQSFSPWLSDSVAKFLHTPFLGR